MIRSVTRVKSWLVIPAMAVVSAAAVIAVSPQPGAIAGAAAAGAALAAAVRALAGDGPAALVAAVLAPLLALAGLAEHGFVELVPCAALAAIAWTVSELARPSPSPYVAMLPAVIAGVLEPAAIVLVPLAATRLVTALPARPRWVIAVPIAGGLAVMLAVIAGSARTGALASLGAHWFGGPPGAADAPLVAHAIGDALGPLVAVAAVAGAVLLARLRLAEVAVLACAGGAVVVDLRAGAVGPATLGSAALCAAFAIGRFAATIRLPPLQAVAGATVALMLLLPPVWTVILR